MRRRQRWLWRLVDPVVYLRILVATATTTLLLLPLAVDTLNWAARPASAGTSACRVVRVVDGDTVTAWCAGKGLLRVRLTGFDTPELTGSRCPAELAAAIRAKWALRQALWKNRPLSLVIEGRDRYGRTLMAAFGPNGNLGRDLIAGGHAVRYDGGERIDWCARLRAGRTAG